MAMTKVGEVIIGSGGGILIEFTNIPQTGKDLLVLLSGRDSGGAAWFRLNNDSTASNYVSRQLRGTGSSAESYTGTSWPGVPVYQSNTGTTANTFANSAVYVSNYTSSTNKSISFDNVYEDNSSSAFQIINAGSQVSSSPVTSIQLASQDTMQQYSSASLYIIS